MISGIDLKIYYSPFIQHKAQYFGPVLHLLFLKELWAL